MLGRVEGARLKSQPGVLLDGRQLDVNRAEGVARLEQPADEAGDQPVGDLRLGGWLGLQRLSIVGEDALPGGLVGARRR